MADRLGLAPTIAYVEGDDLLPRLGELVEAGIDLAHFETGEPVGDVSRFISANAYLGCWGIVDALERGADIVVTGRVTDAAVVCGPAAWHHGWARDDWDALAGAVVAGHVIECGTQATGGNYSFFTEVPGLVRPGFPWAEVAADGSSVIGKHDGTGGQVSVGTVTSQLLYEIGSPAYLGPDVTARFDTIGLSEPAPDRVRISGTRGEPPPRTLKVAMNELGGFRNDMTIALTGLDIEAKAELVEAGFWAACPFGPDDLASVTTSLVRTDSPDPATNEEAVALWRLSVKDPDERKVGRAVVERRHRAGAGQHPRLLRHRWGTRARPSVRRLPPGRGPGRPGAAARRRPRRRPHRGRLGGTRGSGRRPRRPGARRARADRRHEACSDRPRGRCPVRRQGGQRQPRCVRPL